MTKNGMILGMEKGKMMMQEFDSALPNRNHFIVAGPGSGKTSGYIIPNVLCETECSLVINDPKGEIYEQTSQIKRQQGYEVHVINFDEMRYSSRYNPLDYVDKDKDASTVANTIVAAKNDTKQKDIWYNSQFALLKALILYAIYELPPEQKNIKGILDFLQEYKMEADEDEGTGISEMDEQFYSLPREHPARRAYEIGFGQSKGNTKSSIIISLVTTLGDFIDTEVECFMEKSDFHLGDVGRKKTVVYVIIPIMDTTWEGVINLFFSQFFQELYKVGKANHSKLQVPVIFWFDEFTNCGKFENVETFLATCRGYGIACCPVIQNITQLQDKYGKERAESIIGNCAIKICLGNVNETTAKYFSELMGKSTVKIETGSSSIQRGKGDSGSTTSQYSYSGRSLMNADEIGTMPRNQLICVATGFYPLLLDKAFHYELWPGLTDRYRVSQMEYCIKEEGNA